MRDMSNKSAKAAFATEVGRKGNKAAMITRDGTGTWYAYVVQRGETGIGPFEEMLGTMRSYATEEKAKRAAIKALDTSGFSRPGAKAKMGRSGGNYFVIRGYANGDIQGERSFDTQQEAEFYGKRMLEAIQTSLPKAKARVDIDAVVNYAPSKTVKTLASRPGAKAKMGFVGTAGRAGAMAARGMQDGAAAYRAGKPAVLNRLDPKYRNWSDKDLEVYGNFWMRGWTGEQMKDMTTRDPKRGTDLPGSRFSRPGAKAKMAKFKVGDRVAYKPHPAQTAGELVEIRKPTSLEGVEMRYGIKQASGAIMWVPEGMVVRASRPGAKARFAAPGIVVKEDAQYIYYYPEEDDRATFADDDGKGAYTVKSNRTGKPVSTKTYRSWEEAVRASNAINEKLPPLKKRKASMSRPGAKAAFGGMRDTKGRGPFTLQYIASGLYGEPTWLLVDKANKVVAQEHNEQSAKEMLRKANAGEPVYVSSRPGAKVTAGRAEDLYRKLSSGSITYANAKEWERLVTEALRLPDYTPPGGDMSLHEIAEDLGGDLMALKTHSGPVPHAKAKAEKASDLEREDVKAGLKLMEKADPAVSDKIRTLIAEGKPQDQAVAIALDMKRRGEL